MPYIVKEDKKNRTRLNIVLFTTILFALIGLFFLSKTNPVFASTDIVAEQTPLDAKTLTKFIDPLPFLTNINGYLVSPSGKPIEQKIPINITMSEFAKQIIPSDFKQGPFAGRTLLWGYNGEYPGPTIEAIRGVPTHVYYENKLINPILQKYLLVDQTIHWADPLNGMGLMDHHGSGDNDNHHHTMMNIMEPYTGPIPTVPHLHGGEVKTATDGAAPEAWFTSDFKLKGIVIF
ncbi:MAG: multicopper oxidase domain-containing protein [Oligoflexia bacterium]|nr:multicopper oxidase domain-containing protein [Oligoflexia bacterium]